MHVGKICGIRLVGNFRLPVDDLEYSLRRRESLLDVVVLPVEPFYGLVKEKECRNEGEEIPRCRFARNHGASAVPYDHCDRDASYHVSDRRGKGPDPYIASVLSGRGFRSRGNNGSGDSVELKVGTEGNQHVVAVKPNRQGTRFALVYVRMHTGKDDTI